MNGNSEMLGKESIGKLLIRLSAPAIVGMLINALYNLVDTAFVGRSNDGINALNALAVAFPIQSILMAITLMFGMGAAALYSIALGEKDYDEVKSIVGTVFTLSILVTTLIAIFGNIFMEEILKVFSTPDSIIPIAKEYLSIIFISNIAFVNVFIGNSMFRAEGNAKVAMNCMIIGALVNIVLDPIFIYDFGFGLGVRGAAIATAIGQIVSFVYVIYCSKTKDTMIKLYKKYIGIDWKLAFEISKVGFPSFVRNFFASLVSVIMFYYLSIYGNMIGVENGAELAQSIYGTANKVIMFLIMPSFGIIQGMQPIIGYNYGAKQYSRIQDVLNLGFKVMFIYFTGTWLAVMIIPNYILMIFVDDPMFIDIGKNILRIQLLLLPLLALNIVPSVYFQALKKAKQSFLVTSSRQLIFLVPALWILPMFFPEELKLYALFIAFPVADLLSVIYTTITYRRDIKELMASEEVLG